MLNALPPGSSHKKALALEGPGRRNSQQLSAIGEGNGVESSGGQEAAEGQEGGRGPSSQPELVSAALRHLNLVHTMSHRPPC